MDGDAPRSDKGKHLMTPMDVPLYLFLAYLTMFVYSRVFLYPRWS
jgi:hypothetical protein